MITFVAGDATLPVGDGAKIIVHVCNDMGAWGKGFVLAISKRWKAPEEAYRCWHQNGGGQPFRLGQVQFVEVQADLWVANLIGQIGIGNSRGKPPIRYEAIREGLKRVAEFAARQAASVHMPRIGCGLAGGKWEDIEPLVEQFLSAANVPVMVYDLAG